MTLQEIEQSTKYMLTPAQVKDVIGCDPHSLRIEAQQNPQNIGFPVIVLGNRVHIPRLAFLHYIKFGQPQIKLETSDFEAANQAFILAQKAVSRAADNY